MSLLGLPRLPGCDVLDATHGVPQQILPEFRPLVHVLKIMPQSKSCLAIAGHAQPRTFSWIPAGAGLHRLTAQRN